MDAMTTAEAKSFSNIWGEFLLNTDEITLDGLSDEEVEDIEYLYAEKGYLVVKYMQTLNMQIDDSVNSVRAGIVSIICALAAYSLAEGNLSHMFGGSGLVQPVLLFLSLYVFKDAYRDLMSFALKKYRYQRKIKHIGQRYQKLETLLYARRTILAIAQAIEDVQ